MYQAQLCLETIENLRQRTEGWLPTELEEILMLMPRWARQNEDFRICVFMFNWIKVARSYKRSNTWLPDELDIDQMLRVHEEER